MEQSDVRATLDRLIRDRGSDYAGLSRLLGKNDAYVQQFIKRGTPRRLAEEDRRKLAQFFGVDEAVLGGQAARPAGDLVSIERLDVDASAGAGALAGDERGLSQLAFPRSWLRNLGTDPAQLSIISVKGDSMEPALADGDEILVDRGDGGGRLRDGIYVIRFDDALIVKRIAINPASRRFMIKSDNPDYPDWPDCAPGAVEVIGRVVWAGRRIV